MRSGTWQMVIVCALGMTAGGSAAQAPPFTPDGRIDDAAAENAVGAAPQFVANQVLVKFRANPSQAAIRGAARRVDAHALKTFPSIGVQVWELGRGISVAEAVRELSGAAHRGSIEYVEPNYFLYAHDLPNDPLVAELWGLHNVGQTGGTDDADIDAPEAWSVQTGSASIVVGVIDTGVDYTHEDLADNIWINNAEANGVSGVDDDGNGYIDDVIGWDFVNDDNDPMDDNSHGTHTSGTIGAVGNNGVGIAGVNWNVRIMPLKFLSASGRGTTDDAIEAILYAASFEDEFGDKIVRVTNNSWGGGRRSKALKDAIAQSGALFVASAGNSRSSKKVYPAGYDLDNIISVAATDDDDQLASFSNYGSSWVDLGAPGVTVLSTEPGNFYDTKSGTSMAAPHVAGVAALVMAEFPGWSNADVKAQILGAVDPIASLSGKTLTGGRLNALNAVGGSPLPPDTDPPAAVTDLASAGFSYDTVSLAWTATGDDGNIGTAFLYDIRYAETTIANDTDFEAATQAEGEPWPQASGSLEAFTLKELASETTYYIAMRVLDEAGNASGLSNVISITTAVAPPPVWFAEVVDPDANGAFYKGIAFDPNGNPAVAYGSGSGVRFASWDGANWNIETADSGGEGVDLAFGPNGEPAISHGWGKLRFASRNGGSWSVDVIERKNAYNDVTSLVFDPSGSPSISYRTRESGKNAGGLRFARWDGAQWNIEVVDSGAGARYSSLAYDPAGNPVIAYSDDLDDDNLLETLKVAWFNGTTWDLHVLETGFVGFGVFASIAFDPITGLPAVIHRKSGIRYHRWDGSSWSEAELIDTSGSRCMLAFGPDGTPWVAYSTGGTTVAHHDGAGWIKELVEAKGRGFRRVIGVDPNGQPVVAYGDGSTGAMKIARRPVQLPIATLRAEGPVVPCSADINSDNSVNVTDLLALLGAWGPNPGHPADINFDSNVNVTDLLALLAAWGVCP